MKRLLVLSTLAFAAACGRDAPLAPDAPEFLIGDSPLSPLTIEYVKTETGPGTARWTGNVTGDAVGSLRTRVLSVRETGHIWHIETLWEIDAGTRSFDAELDGTLDTRSGKLLLTGRIVSGMLVGARVHDTGQLTGIDPVTGGTVFEGSIRIMTGSAGHRPLRGTMLISAGFDDFWGEIYTMRPDGSGLTRLTDAPGAVDDAAKWSPDGSRIAFHSNRAGTTDIYVMNSDGSGLVQLTSGPEEDAFPTWSPDGRRIAFGRDEPDPGFRPNVYVIDVDGPGLTRLTNDTPAERSPIWSPDGERILYAKGGGRPDVWVMNADGTDQRAVLATPEAEWATDWGPNGQILVTQRVDAATGNFEVFVMNEDGTGLTQLTDRPGPDLNALWSWDMRRIVLAYTHPANVPGITDIWVMNADGTGLTAITSTSDMWEWNSDWRRF